MFACNLSGRGGCPLLGTRCLATLVLVCGFVSTSPVAAQSNQSREFVHEQLDGLRLKRLEVVVSIASPPRVLSEKFDLSAPPLIRDDSVLWLDEAQHTETVLAMIRVLRSRLDRDGYDSRFWVRADVQVPAAETESIHTASSTLTVAALRARSGADAILVVRAIPADSFVVDRGVGSKIIETPQGRERVREFRPEKREGRLMLGQAFLFDRQTGLRLWSRHAPDYPQTNRLTPGHAFLSYGYVGPLTKSPLAQAAALGFTSTMLATFPAPQVVESSDAREVLRQTDRALDRARQQFADRHPWALELAWGWSYERFALPLSLFDEALPVLDHATLAPSGLMRLAPRLKVHSASGWIWSVALPWTTLPTLNFERTYFKDEPRSDIGSNARDRLAKISASGLNSISLELSAGPAFMVRPNVLLTASAGLFTEVLLFEVSPAELLKQDRIVRLGALLSGEITYFPEGQPDFWFLSGRGQLRFGYDFLGKWAVDTSVTLGAGILL
jgi:hypothetical protein